MYLWIIWYTWRMKWLLFLLTLLPGCKTCGDLPSTFDMLQCEKRAVEAKARATVDMPHRCANGKMIFYPGSVSEQQKLRDCEK